MLAVGFWKYFTIEQTSRYYLINEKNLIKPSALTQPEGEAPSNIRNAPFTWSAV
jgi:hypothetical protein